MTVKYTYPLRISTNSSRIEAQHGNKAYLPTEDSPPSAGARVSPAHADEEWPRGSQAPSSQGSASAGRDACSCEEGQLERVGDRTGMPDRRTWRFPSRDHLRRPQDFHSLRRDGRVIRHPVLNLSLRPNSLEHNRYGFVVGRQVGGAVVRNRIRRRLREVIRSRRPRISVGYDFVLIARPMIVGQPYAELVRIVDELLERAGLLREV